MSLTYPLFEIVPIEALLFPAFKSRVDPLEALDELALSISQIGVLEPILVRPRGDLYEVVAGERRARAAKKAGLFEVPVVVRTMSDQEAMEAQLVENLQRKDLSDYEKGLWLSEMIKRFGYTQKALAEKIGKSEAWISHHLDILKVETIPELTRVNSEKLTEFQARILLSANPDKRARIAAQIEETGEVPSARELERLINPSDGAIQDALVITVPAGTPESPPDADTIVQDISPEAPAEPYKIEGEVIEKPTPEQVLRKVYTDYGPDTSESFAANMLLIKCGMSNWEAVKFVRDFSKPPTPTTAHPPPQKETTAPEPKPAPKELVQAEFTCKTCGERFLIVHMHPSGSHALKPIREKVTES
jgi:ParB family chromosome partitioning protein